MSRASTGLPTPTQPYHLVQASVLLIAPLSERDVPIIAAHPSAGVLAASGQEEPLQEMVSVASKVVHLSLPEY